MTMTIDDEIQLAPATSDNGQIIPEGRYTLHLIALEKAPPSTFQPEAGPRIKWIFNLYDQQGAVFMFNGDIYDFYRTTSTKNSPRAFARQYAEALLGRKLDDHEVPRLADCIGKRMSGLISYGPSANDPTIESLQLGSLKHVFASTPTPAAAPRPAPGQVSADPTEEDVDRALVITTLEKRLARLKKIDAVAGAEAKKAYDASELDTAPIEALKALSEAFLTAINNALDE